MAWRIAKHTMGIQNDDNDTYKRDTVLIDVWKRSGLPGRSWAYELQGAQPWWEQKRQGNATTARPSGRAQDASRTKARYKDCMAKYYNSRVRHRDFQVGDLVLRKVMGTDRDPTQGKLGPNWEGPYRVASWQRKGTYHLETLEGQKLPHPWNTKHLRKYYQ